MNDKMKFPFWDPDWMSGEQGWLQNQNQFMDAWSSFQKFAPNSPSAISPMYEAMNCWWKSAEPSLSSQNRDFYDKMMQQGQTFYSMGEQFSKLVEGMQDTKKQSSEWQRFLDNHFESMRAALEGANVDILGGLSKEHLEIAGMTTLLNKLLSMPGVGPDRQKQAQIQKGIKLLNDYQQVFNEYNIKMNKVGIEALQVMRVRIMDMAEQEKEINSLREIYDLWVDCNENAYAELVYTDEYSELYGRLTNALLAVKQHNGKALDQVLEKFNIPTRQAMNTVLKRLQETKRIQSKTMAKVETLEKEIQVLRKLVGNKKESSSTTNQKTTDASRSKKKVRKEPSRTTGNKKVLKKISKKKASNKKVSKKKPSSMKKTSSKNTNVIDL